MTKLRIAGALPTFAVSGYTTFRTATDEPPMAVSVPAESEGELCVFARPSLVQDRRGVSAHPRDRSGVNPIYGRFTFNAGTSTKTCFSCNNMLDFLFGAPAKYEETSFFVAHLRQNMYFGYLQDDWKASDRLTLNLGMRYEYGSRFSDKDNLLTNFDPATTPQTLQMAHAKPGNVYDRTLINPT